MILMAEKLRTDKGAETMEKIGKLRKEIMEDSSVLQMLTLVRKETGKDADKVIMNYAESVKETITRMIGECRELVELYAKMGNYCAEAGDAENAAKYYADAVLWGRSTVKGIEEPLMMDDERRACITGIALVILDIARKTGDKKLEEEANGMMEGRSNAIWKSSFDYDARPGKRAVPKKKRKPQPYDAAYG